MPISLAPASTTPSSPTVNASASICRTFGNRRCGTRLRQVWLDPKSLNPALRRAQVTRDIAALLAKLAAALEGNPGKPRHAPKHVATFLIRCIFCMFAQSVHLLPERSFSDLLTRCRGNLPAFVGLVGELWRMMDAGGFSAALAGTVLRFNGGLFRPGASGPADPLTITADELELLITAAAKDWADVEPAIFGTLLEKALDAKERGRLGAQFTPRAFVERLVLPTVMEPLRIDWDGVRAAAEGELKAGNARAAADLVRGFHAQLCAVRVLDPACGTGNFLYVTLELMKRLEGEVLDTLAGLDAGEVRRLDMGGATVDPHQFLGLDVNPRAVPVAELVLWIGYLQWHFRTHGKAPPAEPILRDFHTIQEQDALLSYNPHRAGVGRGRQAGDALGRADQAAPDHRRAGAGRDGQSAGGAPDRCDAGSMAGSGIHRRQSALRSRQGLKGGAGQRLRRGAVESIPQGAAIC